MSHIFRILSLWDFNKEGFYLTLAPHNPSSLDQVDWSNQLNEPVTSVLPVYQRCAADIQAHHRNFSWNCLTRKVAAPWFG